MTLVAIGNHIWQSTLIVGVAWLVTLALKKNAARIRYAVWLVASTKFLIPFSILVSVVGTFQWRPAQMNAPKGISMIEIFSQPFDDPISAVSVPVPSTHGIVEFSRTPWLLLTAWFIGFIAVVSYWYARSRRVTAVVRVAESMHEGQGLEELRRLQLRYGLVRRIRYMCSRTAIEPGVHGIIRPVLLLPTGISERLDSNQLDSIIVHELCHIRRHDNLTVTIHMAVESIFWFHPLAWWIGSRLLEERELACDEAVIEQGIDPQTYAGAILKVCEFYLASPFATVAGVTGSILKKRIEAIMQDRTSQGLKFAKKLLLASAGIAALAGPVVLGVIIGVGNGPELHAQSSAVGQTQTLPPPQVYAYEMISIHPAKPGQRGVHIGPGPQGGLNTTNTPVMELLTFAFDVRDYQFVGAPDWVYLDRFDVSFTPDKADIPPKPGASISEAEGFNLRNQKRLQAVLRDRFGLVLRSETRELPIYALTQVKNGNKLSPPADLTTGSGLRGGRGGLLIANGATLKLLTDELSSDLGRPVTNETGLSGQYDFKLRWNPRLNGLPDAVTGTLGEILPPDWGESIFAALTNQLGLRLESKKGPVIMYVIGKIQSPS